MNELRDASSDVVYRPLSTMALIGFGMSCLFGGVVVVCTLIAIVQGAAFFFSNWVLLALLGFLVSWWGLNDVRNSEGTKAGQKLATIGMWISLVTGCGYFAYSYFTGLALSQQAFAFLLKAEEEHTGFIPHLQKASEDPVELRRAFLMALPAPDRRDARAEDEKTMIQRFDQPKPDGGPGPLSVFRTHQLIQAIMQSGSKTTVEQLGIKDWKSEKRSYNVSCLLRIRTLELHADLLMIVRSSEGEVAGQKRQWFLDLGKSGYTSIETTRFGNGLKTLREHAMTFLNELGTNLKKGVKIGDFARLDETDWTAHDAATVAEVKPRVADIFNGSAKENTFHMTVGREITFTPWERDSSGRVAFTLSVSFMLLNDRFEVINSVPCYVTLRTARAVDPEQIAADDVPMLPEWEVTRVKVGRIQSQRKT